MASLTYKTITNTNSNVTPTNLQVCHVAGASFGYHDKIRPPDQRRNHNEQGGELRKVAVFSGPPYSGCQVESPLRYDSSSMWNVQKGGVVKDYLGIEDAVVGKVVQDSSKCERCQKATYRGHRAGEYVQNCKMPFVNMTWFDLDPSPFQKLDTRDVSCSAIW